MAITVEQRTAIIELVVGMFGAAPGANVLSDLVAAYEAGNSIKQIAANLAKSDQFKSIFPTFMTNGEFAAKVVDQLVGSEVVAAEKAAAVTLLTAQLNSGKSRSDVFADAISALNAVTSTNAAWGNAAVAFDNKVAAAVYYSVDKQLSGSSLAGLQAVVSSVTSSAASLNAAKAAADAAAAPAPAPVQTFTLTADATSVNEGSSALFTLTTTNVSAGAQYSYAISGVSATDVTGGSLTGTVTIGADGKALIPVSLVADSSTEGAETLTVTVAGRAASVTVADTSLTPAPTPRVMALSTGVDTGSGYTGAATNDIFNASLSGAIATLNNLDALDGGEGTDTLNVELNGVVVTPVALTSIEQINITSTAANSNLDLTNSTGLTGITSSASAGSLTLSNIQSTATAVTISNSTQAHTINFAAAAVAGAADSVSVSLNNVTADPLLTIGAGVETLALNVAGTNDVDTAFAGAVTVVGAGTLTLTAAADAVLGATTVDASLNSGGITVAMSNAAHTVTGGSGADNITGATGTANRLTGNGGNDTITAGSGNDTVSGGDGNDSIVSGAGVDNLDGGAGNDTFNMGTAGDLAAAGTDTIIGGDGTDTLRTTSADAIAYTTPATRTISGIENLTLADALEGALTVANIDTAITTVSIAGSGAGGAADSIVGPAGTLTVNLSAALASALTVTDTGTATTDVLNIVNTAAATNVGAAQNLTITQYETVNINGSGTGAATAQTLGTIGVTADTGGTTAVNFTGSNAYTVQAITAASISAAGLTGTATFTMGAAPVGATNVTGSANADTLLGSATATTISGGGGIDNITGGAAADSISGDAGNDVIVGNGGNDTLSGGDGDDNITGNTGNDSILGGAGNDTIATNTGADTVDGGDGNDGITSLSTTTSTLMGGAGNDTITNISGGNLNISGGDGDDTIVRTNVLSLTDTISGGEGGTDILSINQADVARIAAGTFAQITTFVNNLSGIDRLTVSDALNAQTLDVSMFDSVGFVTLSGTTAGGGAETVANLVDNSTVVMTAANAGDLVLNYATTTGAQTLNLELASAAGFNAGTITAAGIETINLFSNDTDVTTGGNATDTIVLTAAAATSLVITGDSATLALTLTGSTALTSVNASAYGGAVTTTLVASGTTYNGAVGVDNVTGSAGADSISGNNGNDVLSGAAGADTIDGGAGDDQITGGAGADVIDGGTGTNTLIASGGDANTGPSTISGVVVNLSAANISYANIFATTGAYLSGALTGGVDAGRVGYLFNGESALNIATLDTVSNIQNVTGGTGADYIVGSAVANTITGGAGADTITGGAGADTFVMVAADVGDRITDFAVAADIIDWNTALLSIDGLVTTPTGYQAAAAGTAIAATTTVFELTGVTTGGTAANLVAALAATATNAAIDAADTLLFVNYLTAGGAQIWQFVDGDGANVDAAELTLVATLTGVAADAMVAANFI